MKATPVVLAAVAAGALAGVAVVSVGERGSADSAAFRDDHSAARDLERRLELLEASIESLSREIGALEGAATVVRAVPTPATAPAPPRAPSTEMATESTSDAERQVAEARARMNAAMRQMRPRIEASREFIGLMLDLENALVSEGFPPERAREIDARVNELRTESRARIEEYRESTGGDPYPLMIESFADIERTLRAELGELDYGRYRRAAGMSSSVHVARVLPGSKAEAAGIAPGDEIVMYDGRRVIDLRDLDALAAEGDPSAPVLIEVIRGGQRLRMEIPRGSLGITEVDAASRIVRENERPANPW